MYIQEVEKANSILKDQLKSMINEENSSIVKLMIKESNRIENRFYFQRKLAEVKNENLPSDDQSLNSKVPTFLAASQTISND